MKRTMLLLAFCGMLTAAMADWTYGTARFSGNQPSSCLHHGTVTIWYNGTLTQKGISGNEEIWEGTGDICVVYPKDYCGPQMRFSSTGWYSPNPDITIKNVKIQPTRNVVC